MPILLVDDEPAVLELLQQLLAAEGLTDVSTESDPTAALRRVQKEPWDLVVLDLQMPQVHGLEILKALMEVQPWCDCLVLTGEVDLSLAVEAMQLGALDYLIKGRSDERLVARVREAMVERAGRPLDPLDGLKAPAAFSRFVTASPKLGAVFRHLERIAPTDLTVVISGPSGTGKELLARAVHDLSKRSRGPFLGINAAAIQPSLFASQLFGHVPGAFSGADRAAQGYVQAAAKGTLFLDEIGELPLDLQAQLLRVLQEREYFVVGESRPTKLEARIVVATNRDLRAEVDEGRFRADLFHRLRAAAVMIPPLRERPEDVALLVEHFVRQFCEELGQRPLRVPPKTLDLLTASAWPGNVRELQNVIREAVLAEETHELRPRSLPAEYRQPPAAPAPMAAVAAVGDDVAHKSLAEMERDHIERVIQSVDGNISQAARILGISRMTLHRRLKAYRLESP